MHCCSPNSAGDRPEMSRISTSAFFEMSHSIMAAPSSRAAAKCKGVRPRSSALFKSAPFWTRASQIVISFDSTAQCKATLFRCRTWRVPISRGPKKPLVAEYQVN